MKVKKLGIIILNYNTWRETVTCVDSIKKYTSNPYVIYVIDNKSVDDSLENLRLKYKQEKDVIVIESEVNKGYSAGNNIGIKRAIADACDILFIVNSDIEILNNAFGQMASTLLKKSSFMMIGPSVLDNNNKEAQIPRRKQTFKFFLFGRHPFCKIPFVRRLGNRLYSAKESKVFAFNGSVSGCCFGMRAEDFKNIGYLDENVFLYCEEDILAYKMERLGKKAVVDMEAKVWHKENLSTNREGNAFVQFHRWTSVLYLLKTYAGINKILQIFVAMWNVLTWSALSLFSKEHRRMLHKFWKRNWKIVRDYGAYIL